MSTVKPLSAADHPSRWVKPSRTRRATRSKATAAETTPFRTLNGRTPSLEWLGAARDEIREERRREHRLPGRGRRSPRPRARARFRLARRGGLGGAEPRPLLDTPGVLLSLD